MLDRISWKQMLGLKWVWLVRWLVVDQCSGSQIQIYDLLLFFGKSMLGFGLTEHDDAVSYAVDIDIGWKRRCDGHDSIFGSGDRIVSSIIC